MKTKFYCEICGEEFDSKEECTKHEDLKTCSNEYKMKNIENALTRICSYFKIRNIHYTEPYINEYGEINFYFTGMLENNTEVECNMETLRKVNLRSEQDIYDYIKGDYEEYLITKYFGVIEPDGEFYGRYDCKLNNKSIVDIFQKLIGKKIEINVLN